MKNSHIEWTDHTFNPWEGCTKVSPGCAHCYAEARNHRFSKGANWGKGAPRRRTSASNWNEPRKWNNEGLMLCPDCGNELKAKLQKGSGIPLAIDMCECGSQKCPTESRRPRVFCASLADVFDPEVPQQWRDDLFNLIAECRNLDWLILTKRPQLANQYLLGTSGAGAANFEEGGCFDHIWLGTTVEDQQRADERIPELIQFPSRVRFLSCEPLLGPLDIEEYLEDQCDGGYVLGSAPIDWVICGFESGPQARPGHPDHARSLRDQCKAAGVPFFFKQWGEWLPWEFDDQQFNNVLQSQNGLELWYDLAPRDPLNLPKGWEWSHDKNDVPGLVLHQRVGKKEAGRLLDGKEHSEFPEVRS